MLHYIIKVFGEPDDMIASLSFANLVSSFPCWLKDCNNGQERENEETVIYESRNDLVQSCWDLAANQVYYDFEKHLLLKMSCNTGIKAFDIGNNIFYH